MDRYRAPATHIAGQFAGPPLGVVLHGSRSGVATRSLTQEFSGTAAYAVSNSDGLCWHSTIGDGVYVSHLLPTEWGWHAREHSRWYLGVEFAQPTAAHTITDGQVRAFAAWFTREVRPAWPHLTLTGPYNQMPMHSELQAGITDGKSDVYPRFDARAADLRARLVAAVNGAGDPTDARLELVWQQTRGQVGEKRYKARLDRPYYAGDVLVCERGVVTPAGALDPGGAVDDLVTYWDAHGVITRY